MGLDFPYSCNFTTNKKNLQSYPQAIPKLSTPFFTQLRLFFAIFSKYPRLIHSTNNKPFFYRHEAPHSCLNKKNCEDNCGNLSHKPFFPPVWTRRAASIRRLQQLTRFLPARVCSGHLATSCLTMLAEFDPQHQSLLLLHGNTNFVFYQKSLWKRTA